MTFNVTAKTGQPLSKTHELFSERLRDPRVLEYPENFLGPNHEAVLNFWLKLDDLFTEQLKVAKERYWSFRVNNCSEWEKASNLAGNASEEVVGRKYANQAGWAAKVVTVNWAAYYATQELIGNVEKPVFLPMFDNL